MINRVLVDKIVFEYKTANNKVKIYQLLADTIVFEWNRTTSTVENLMDAIPS